MSVFALDDMVFMWIGWVVLMLLSLTWGSGVLRLLSPEKQPFFSFRSFWTGWVMLVGALQIWHFFLPITILTLVIFGFIGIVIVAFTRARFIFKIPNHAVIGVFAVLLFLVSDHALRGFESYDNALYHLQTIQWNHTYPIVPGLGNLHGRFAFNQSYFLYLTLFDYTAVPVNGSAIVNGSLMMVLALEGFYCLIEVIKTRRLEPELLVAPLLLIPLANITFTGLANYAGSPNADYIVLLISFKVGIELLRLLLNPHPNFSDYAFIVILVCAIPIIKVSGAVYSVLVLMVMGLSIWRKKSISFVHFSLVVIGVASFLIVPWLIRNIILSGYLVYPGTFGAFPVDWRVAEASAIDDANWIRSWARHPESDLHWSEVLANWNWLDGWWKSFWDLQGIRPGVFVTCLAWSAVTGVLLIRRRLPQTLGVLGIWSAPAMGQLVFWFFSAPSPRFGLAYIWLLGIGGVLLFLECVPILRERISDLLMKDTIISLGVIGMIASIMIWHGAFYSHGFVPVESATLYQFETDSGLILNVPDDSDLCWNAPLPCTPYAKRDLRLREPGNLGAGFTIQPLSP